MDVVYGSTVNPFSGRDEAEKVAKRELAERNANAETYEYQLAYHQAPDGVYYTVDTLARIIDELPRPLVDKVAYITKRAIVKNKTSTSTSVVLVPSGAIQL
jgi:prophage tail gpP-like protein